MTLNIRDQPEHLHQLSGREQQVLTDWCKDNFISRKTPTPQHSSYGLKHRFEAAENGFYITNGQFKGAMLKAGFKPVDRRVLNWIYCISTKSPALQVKR